MFFLYIAVLLGAFAILFWVLKARKPASEWEIGGFICTLVTVFAAALPLFLTGTSYYDQVSDIEELPKYEEMQETYRNKAQDLTERFAGYLAEKYPEHEKEIFANMSPKNLEWYFVKYPEIQSSETLMKLVDKIDSLQSDVYDQELKAAQTRKDIRTRLRNPWIFNSMIPGQEYRSR